MRHCFLEYQMMDEVHNTVLLTSIQDKLGIFSSKLTVLRFSMILIHPSKQISGQHLKLGMTTSFYFHMNVWFTDLLIILCYIVCTTNGIIKHTLHIKKHKRHGHEFLNVKQNKQDITCYRLQPSGIWHCVNWHLVPGVLGELAASTLKVAQ